MASIHKQVVIDARPDEVWSALRDWGALHERLVPGFVIDTQLEGDDRIVTFFNGAVARERLVDLDDDRRRLVWSIVEGSYTHHNGCAAVFEEEGGRTRFEWTTDLLPHEATEPTEAMMERGIEVIKATLEAAT